MASPRRARSLFLSPDKAELLAAKEINNLVHRVEVVPRKSVPRQGRRTDIVEETSFGNESRISTSSSNRSVDTFCRESRPPSVALDRLSYLNKELPPAPLFETPNQILSQSTVLSRTSTQKHAAAQTIISVQSRYSTQIKPSTPSRLSPLSSHFSSQRRDSEDRISIRSHFSTRDFPTHQAVPHSEPRASVAIDRRQRSVVGDFSKKEVRRQYSGSISPGTVPDQESSSAAASREVQVSGWQKAEIDSRACQDIQDPLTGTGSKEIVLRDKSKRERSVGWTFHDGFILRADDKLKSTTRMSSGGGSLALGPISRPVVPVRWTFHDGIIYKRTKVSKNEDGVSEAKSKRILPIGWSFYDGLTIRPDGSVKATSKATGESTEILLASKPKRMIPIGWTFHDGLIFATHESVKSALISSDKSHGTEIKASSGRLPITWTFHEGLTFATHESVRSALNSAGKSNGTEIEASSKRLPVSWTFHGGLTFATHESVKSALNSPDQSNGTETEASSKRLPIAWTFHEGLSLRTDSKVNDTIKTNPNNDEFTTEFKSKRTVGWTFNEGIVIRKVAGMSPDDGELVNSSRQRYRRPKTSSPADSAEETAGETAKGAEDKAGETAGGVEDAPGEAGEGVEALKVDGVEGAAEGVAQELPVHLSVLKGLEPGEGAKTLGADGEAVGKIEEGDPEDLIGKTIGRQGLVATGGGVPDETAGSISTKSLPVNPLSADQNDHRTLETVDEDDHVLFAVSSSSRKTQQNHVFEAEDRAIAAALARRQRKHQSPIELDELIKEGRLIYDQFRQQAQKLQKQRVLVDEMLEILGSTSDSVKE